MNESLTPSASDLITSVTSSDPLPMTAFEEHRHRPFEFTWVRVGEPGNYDYEYRKRYTDSVVAARTTSPARRGGARTPSSCTASALLSMAFACSDCGTSHSPAQGCTR
jgi:hypothetical protein